MKNLITTIFFTLIISSLIGQNSKIWVTAENSNALREISDKNFIVSYKKALPASRQKKLQKVYEIQTNDLLAFLRLVEKSSTWSNPEVIEEFTPLYTTNDLNTEFSNDYALSLINAEQAWDITNGDPLISIGILDTGYDTLHHELTGGFNHVSTIDPGANLTHGTAVAITAAGNTDNNIGKSSIGFNCQLSLRNMSYNEMLNATYSGIRVINVSWASGCMNNAYYQSVIDEVYNNGTVIIAAAGNGSTCGGPNQLVYPAAFNNVIAVTSVDENDHHQPVPNDPNSTHQHNSSVDISAPGYNVALSIEGNQYLTGNGTSFAAPYVSGTVGLMLSVNPCLTPDEIENILKQTADDIYGVNQNYLGLLGAGRLNAQAAVQMAKDMHPIKISVNKNNSTCNTVPGVFVSLDSGAIANHSIQWSDGSHDWNRYNLPDGNYSFMVSNSNGCMLFDTVSYTSNGPDFDYINSIEITSSTQELSDLNNDGVIKIKGTVIINSGVTYELRGKNLKFAPNTDLPNNSNLPTSGIVVQPDAELLINDCTIDVENECVSTWGGIEVRSNGLNQPGMLNFINSEIHHAQIGISTISKDQIGINEEEGGKIYVDMSLFSNNQKAVYLSGQGRTKFLNKVFNSDFIISESVSNSIMVQAVNLEFSMYNCFFQGNSNLIEMSRGTGIYLDNAQISGENNLKTNQNYKAQLTTLEKGVFAKNNASGKLQLSNFLLSSNLTGVELVNSKYVIIRDNSFELNGGTYSDRVTGIIQNGESNASILNNTFHSTGNNFTSAISLDAQHDKNNIISKNNFIGNFGNAIEFIGDNKVEQFACNDFNLFSGSDVSVLEKNNINGSLEVNDNLLLNDFSECINVNSNLNFMESSNLFTYTDHSGFVPNCTNGNVQVQYLSSTVDREDKCKNLDKAVVDIEYDTKDNLKLSANMEEEGSTNNILYPNPNNGEFNVVLSDNIDEIRIFNNTGKLVKQVFQYQLSGTINVNLAAGHYTVAYLSTGDTKEISKMIVQ